MHFRIAAAAAVSVLAACAGAQAAERNFTVASFDSVEASGSQTVSVATGKAASVRAEGSAADLDKLDIRVDGGKLEIGTKSKWGAGWSSSGPVRVFVTVPMVREVAVAGSGSVSVDRVKVPTFSAEVAGSGSARIAALDAQNANFSTAGSGSVEASGTCTDAKAETAGSGAIRIGGLKCATLKAETAGSGDIDAFASKSADISIMGSGTVHVAGGAKCTTSTMGSGKAICS